MSEQTTGLKALSIRTPWPRLICLGIKDVENRSWYTKYRGKLYLQASSKKAMYTCFEGWVPGRFRKMAWNCIRHLGPDIPADEKILSTELKQHPVMYVLYGKHIEQIVKFYEYVHLLSDAYGKNILDRNTILNSDTENAKMLKNEGYAPFHSSECIVGYATLTDIIETSRSDWASLGDYHWLFTDEHLYKEPLAGVKGKLNLFDVSEYKEQLEGRAVI